MKRCWKFVGSAVVLCLCCVAVPSWGEPPAEKPTAAPAVPDPRPVARAQNLVAVACPLYVSQVHEDYTSYYAVVCDPGPVQYVLLDSFHNSALGPCGMNPDCVPYGTFARTGRLTDPRLASTGLPRLGDPAARTRLGKETELLDEQLVDIVPESATPAAPVRVRLFLLKHRPEGSSSTAQLIGNGHEVRRDPGKAVPLVLAARTVEVTGKHTCSVRLGDVNYHVVLHHSAEALLPANDFE